MQRHDRRRSPPRKPHSQPRAGEGKEYSTLEALYLVPFYLVIIAWVLKWLGKW
jgi:hypothetical protein